ncbi:WD repeat-containing protein 81 [Armadillidium nasatum]|uniref:WD repeat-containing protein 81 n=1 Tax=Armadillidium nasatum TaxID=96803 RepID=A0A5N5SLR5_9CRUS|nr:WD repeat-containing protein 81 [Armadillidium nasatum]
MSIIHEICIALSINPFYCSGTRIDQTIECYLCGQWIRSVRRDLRYTPPPTHPLLTPEEIQSSLQLGESVGENWQKFLIQALPKCDDEVFALPKLMFCPKSSTQNQWSYFQILNHVSETNTKLLWEDSYLRFENHAVIKQWKEGQKSSLKSQKSVIKNALRRLYNSDVVQDDENIFKDGINLNIHPALFIIEADRYFFVFMKPTSYSIWDCVNFSPAKLKENEFGSLFVLHQLLEGVQNIHDSGLFLGNITLHHLRFGSDFLLTIIPEVSGSILSPDLLRAKKDTQKPCEGNVNDIPPTLPTKQNEESYLKYLSSDQAKTAIHNVLKILFWISLKDGYFAGHSFESPVYYPILPWVIDFTSPSCGWRDFTKTKYRLNKGDQQLNHTYELTENDPHVDQIAHHIPELFSEVTYYVYKARVTPKVILRKHVRQQFVPSHYPSSIARMYTLTPEECIPEFYCDASVFKSIHDDLPDLEVPSWCDGVEEFLQMHRTALESNYVSRRLHHWIDLYYGYKLTGSASVKAKNVCLPLVDDHSTLSRGGIVQLFNIPHPPKLTPSPFLTNEAFNLRHVRDIQVVGCLIVQIFSAPRSRILCSGSNFEDAYNLALKILQEPNDIPKCLHNALRLIFQLDQIGVNLSVPGIPSKFSAVSEYGLPPLDCNQMLQSLMNVISFPLSFSFISSFIKNMKSFSNVLEEYYFSTDSKKEEFIKNLTEKHIKRTVIDLKETIHFLSFDGLKLILPYTIELYSNPLSAVCAALYFTNIITQALGPSDSRKYILPLLTKLYELDSISKIHMKLFHKPFLLQLMIRFRLKTFLKHFITPIIEGAGGYKATVEGNSNTSAFSVLKRKSKTTSFGMDEPQQSFACEENISYQNKCENSNHKKQLKRRNSSIRSPSEIFVFEGGDDEDTLNDFGGSQSMDMNDSLKSPISDTLSLEEEESLQEGGGSIPSLCPSPHSPNLSGGETEDQTIYDDLVCETHIVNEEPPSDTIPIPHSKLMGNCSKDHVYSSSLPEKPFESRGFQILNESSEEKLLKDFISRSKANPFKEENLMKSDISGSLAEICCETILWLSHRLGPVLTAKYLTRNLLRMLSLCYLPESGALTSIASTNANSFSITKKEIAGDNNASKIISCLLEISDLYGEQVILLQYLSHITELVSWCGNKLNTNQESGLIGAMTLLQHLLLKLSDVTFMDYLQDTLIRNAVYPVIRLLSSLKVSITNGVVVRSILAWRVIDSLCIMIRRVGREMSKEKLSHAITRFTLLNGKIWKERELILVNGTFNGYISQVLEELKNVFTPELAYLSYVPLCRFLGTKYMEDSLPNHDLLRSLCLQFDENKQADHAADLSFGSQVSLEGITLHSDSPSATNVAVTGNRIDIKDTSDNFFEISTENVTLESQDFEFDISKFITKKNDNVRHLRGNWLAYWEHEIGRSEQDDKFAFKQIKLQSFVGHSNSVKSLYVMDNENSFISCSKDKTVKLWSLRSQGDGTAETGPQWTYSNHKKSVFDVVFCESLRLAASCDSTVHIWDPFTGTCLKQLDSLRHSPVTVSSSSVGLVRCLATSDDSTLVAVAHSSGVIATLDLRTGHILATWKPHEGEVLALQWYEKGTFVSSALDQTVCVWSVYDSKLKFLLKGPSEPVHILRTLGDQVITGTTANRVGLHTVHNSVASLHQVNELPAKKVLDTFQLKVFKTFYELTKPFLLGCKSIYSDKQT